VLYDGECAVCRRTADRIARSAPEGAFEFVPCGAGGPPGRFSSLDARACREALHLVLPDGTVLAGERAAAEILSRLPPLAWLGRIARLPGARLLAGLFYRAFARHRRFVSRLLFGRP